VKGCDEWLNNYFEIKNNKNPDQDEIVLYSSSELPEAQRAEYERNVAKMRLGINEYLQDLERLVDEKIKLETKK
jgi:hypothetical protein